MHTPPPGRKAKIVVDDDLIKTKYPSVYAHLQASKQSGALNEIQINQPDLFLPKWPDSVRGVPNAALRSALFGAIKKGSRAYLERKEIHAQEGVHIVFTGARLDQVDLDVWETVLHAARLQKLGDECRASGYQILKMLGKTDSGANRNTLDRCLSRMKATAVDVRVGTKYSYEGSLIDEVYRSQETRGYIIRLNRKLIALFEADQFTQIDWSVRARLKNKPLAQWLHGYYSTHAKPHPVRLETLLKLSGSSNVDAGSAKQTMVKALNSVKCALEESGQTFSFHIAGDLIHIKKMPTGSQDRHLAKKARSLITVAAHS
jgi:hypothetical protein